MAQALCEILRLEKYEVDHFEDGLSGVEAIERDIYDVSILDVMLPGINGFEIVKRARREGIRTPILMLTAKAELDVSTATLSCTSNGQSVRHSEKECCILE